VAASRLSKPGWKILGGVAGLALLVVVGPRLLGRSEFFRVHRVEVRGIRSMRAEAIVKRLPIRAGQSIFSDLDAVRRAADSLPGLDGVQVSRRLPGTVVITIEETPAVALVMREGRLQPVGAAGKVLPFDPSIAAPDVPIVREADSVVTRFLAHARAADPTFFGRIVSAWRSGEDVVLTVDTQRYWFRPDAPAEVIRAVMAVAQDLDKKGRRWAELDARFAGQVVVRWGDA
jgi:hypothetical protein